MANSRPKPYLESKAGDLFTAASYNEVQVQQREEIAARLAKHELDWHSNDPANPKVSTLTASAVSSGTVSATSVTAGSLAGDAATFKAASVGQLEVTGRISGAGIASLNLSPQVWSAAQRHQQGETVLGVGISLGWGGSGSLSYGPHCGVRGSLGAWIGVPPQLTLKVETAGLLTLDASWTENSGANTDHWAQFVIGSGGRFALVRTYEGDTIEGQGGRTGTYVRPANPTASTFAAWLKYHWDFYVNRGWWPSGGAHYSGNTGQSCRLTDCIEVPAGTYTINVGFSGIYVGISGLQLRATFFPGGKVNP